MASDPLPEGIFSFLDTDLYKLTMQCAVLEFFPDTQVKYRFNNRTPDKRLSKEAFAWLEEQVARLVNIRLSQEELKYLKETCKYLKPQYLSYLEKFQLRPKEQVHLSFTPVDDSYGDLNINVSGLWTDTILYEVPLLALTSEAYFKFVDKDWTHDGQQEKGQKKGIALFEAGCIVSEFGSRRRRDFKTQDMVIAGLVQASKEAEESGLSGKLSGTSNVYFAMKHGIPPVGTVAHEWYMGLAAIKDDYENANELGLKYWVEYFGEGVLGIALTDTFGTPAFFKAFKKSVPGHAGSSSKSYAEVFQGIRQDSGEPKDYVDLASEFYQSVGISGKSIIFSDSLNVEKCIEYKAIAEQHGFKPSFGVGTFFTNDFSLKSDSTTKSKPLNIVIKISEAGGRPAIKISDDIGKNTGDKKTVEKVKSTLGYSEHEGSTIDESKRW